MELRRVVTVGVCGASASRLALVAPPRLHRRRRVRLSDAPDVQALDVGPDGVVVLGIPIQVHGDVEMQQGFPVSLQFHIHLAQLEVHACLLWCQAPHFLQVAQSFFVPLQLHQDARLVEVRHAVRRLALSSFMKVVQRQQRVVQSVQHHTQITSQNGIVPVDFQGLDKVVFRILMLLLSMVDIAETPPCIVMPRVDGQRLLIHGHGLVELFVRDKLMPAKSVGVCE
mmetsp:Transcript_112942/g.221430  ORF Transcript_112942/g.221430 Transcript_112942/m.221430 type:complete len:226 (-) Transcript_112942:564-1241(-)